MQIKITPKPLNELPQSHTRVTFVQKGVERFVEKGDSTELHIVAGDPKKITPRTFRTLIRKTIQSAKKYKVAKIALPLTYESFPKLHVYSEAWMMRTVAENILLADYTYTAYKSKTPKEVLKEILISGPKTAAAKTGLKEGVIVGTHSNLCRDLANTPGGDMTPALLAKEAQKLIRGTAARVSVLDAKKIAALKMGGVLAVGKGAADEPKFIIVEYWGAGKPTKNKDTKENQKNKPDKQSPVVLVGKGITFDTGGLQMKPGMAMYEMHLDMSGGAAVLTAIAAAAKLGLRKNIVALVPAAENAVSGTSMRPGDVLTMMSGKTVDVLHTDAEGRLVLADALHYARRYNPRLVVDVATLTGASLSALGQHAHALMTKDRALEDILRDLGEESGDYVSPLPLWDEYVQYTKGIHADIVNLPPGDARFGGAINGGTFLSHFTRGLKWAHIDMAPRMTSTASDHVAKGATGEPVRLLLKIAEHF